MGIKEINIAPLTLEETISHLMGGGIVVVTGMGMASRDSVLVRLDPRALPVTQISYDINRTENSQYFKPYWTVFDIPFNYFVTKDIYAFTDAYKEYPYIYKIGDAIEYQYQNVSGEREVDIAYIQNIYFNEETKEYTFGITGTSELIKGENILRRV